MAIAPPAHTRGESTTDSWITPRWLVDRLGPFDLDPCQCIPQPWPCAAKHFTEEDNGLGRSWDGLVWCNPPYGKQLGLWLQRCSQHGNAIALIFARTETQAFFKYVWPTCSAVLFLRGRLTFHYPDGSTPRNGANSGGPSVLIGWGDTAADRLSTAADLGQLVRPIRGERPAALFESA
jgi:hypothetical protein